MRLLGVAGLIALLNFVPGCSGEGISGTSGGGGSEVIANISDKDVMATVDGFAITRKEFEQTAARKTPADGKTLSMEEKREVINKLIEEKILYLQALDKGLDRDPKVQRVMVNTLLREEVYSKVRNTDFSDEDLRAYYEETKSEFVVPEKVQVKRILIRITPDRDDGQAAAEAERLRAEIERDPEAFKELATEFSDGPYKRRGGDLGFISHEGKPGVSEEIIDAAFEMEENTLSQVFMTDEGYNILQVTAKRASVTRTFQQMKGSVLRMKKNEKLQEMYEQYVNTLKEGVEIELDEEKMENVIVEISNRGGPGGQPGLQLDGVDEPDGRKGLKAPNLAGPQTDGLQGVAAPGGEGTQNLRRIPAEGGRTPQTAGGE